MYRISGKYVSDIEASFFPDFPLEGEFTDMYVQNDEWPALHLTIWRIEPVEGCEQRTEPWYIYDGRNKSGDPMWDIKFHNTLGPVSLKQVLAACKVIYDQMGYK